MTAMSGGTLSLINKTADLTQSFQWASSNGMTDFSQPIAQFTIQPSANVSQMAATLTNISVNNKFYQDSVNATLPMLLSTPLNTQVYTVKGHVYEQFNVSGMPYASTSGTPFDLTNTNSVGKQIPLPNVDIAYSVASTGKSDLNLVLEKSNLVLPTASSTTGAVNLDLVASNISATASKVPFALTVNLPSDSTGQAFVPGVGVTATASVSGHLMTVTGTYTAAKGNTSTTPTLGVISSNLTAEFNAGSQFSIDSASIGGASVIGQSLFVGFAQTDNNGAYALTNVPAGSLNVYPQNNPTNAQNQTSHVTVSDALTALNIAAGTGIPSLVQNGLASSVIDQTQLLPSDYLAADFNGNGVVTASDALQILQYYVAVAKPTNLAYTYIPATSNATANTAESITNVVLPTFPAYPTDKNPVTQGLLATGDDTKVIDIIGILPGDVTV